MSDADRQRVLSDDEITRMRTPLWEQAKDKVRSGESDDAIALIDRAVEQWAGLKDYSINWITSLLTFIGEELGEEAVERALRKTGDEFVGPRRDTGTPWASLPAAARAKVIARAMLGNMGEVDVEEDDEKITLSFRCGSGGKLIDDGRYDGDAPVSPAARAQRPHLHARRAVGVLRALLREQRDPAGRMGREPDERRVPARASGRTVRAPPLQGHVTDAG